MGTNENTPNAVSILCVEDEEISRLVLCSALKKRYPEAQLYVAVNGADGLDLCKMHGPKIIVTDISMPVMDGLQMISAIRLFAPDIPVIALSACDDTQHKQNAADIGINYYLPKPYELTALFEMMDTCIDY